MRSPRKDKPLAWLRGEIKSPPFGAAARVEAGYLLRRLQAGEMIGLPMSRDRSSRPVVDGCGSTTVRVAKRRQLLQRGWAVGDVDEFLGLTPEERALVDLRLRLANGLKLRRAQRRLTQGELARVVRSSQSRVAKMEAGDPSVSIDLLLRSLIALGASNSDLATIISGRGLG
jgi:hypothetical protein